MTKETILKKAIQKAVKNGYKEDVHFSYLEDGELVKVHHIGLGETTPNVYSIIFSHDFAKAFWGEKLMRHPVAYNHLGNMPTWQYHLQQMVISKNRIKYLKKFI